MPLQSYRDKILAGQDANTYAVVGGLLGAVTGDFFGKVSGGTRFRLSPDEWELVPPDTNS